MIAYLLPILFACGGSASVVGPEAESGPTDNPPSAESYKLIVKPSPVSLAQGESSALEAEITDDDGDVVEDVGEVRWSSSDTLVAAVDQKGTVEGVGTGTAYVRAHFTSESGESTTDSARVEISKESRAVASVSVKPESLNLTVDDTGKVSAVARDDKGNILDRPIAWASDDETVVVVSADGTITTRSTGQTYVAATAGNITAHAEVTVEPEPEPTPPSAEVPAFPGASGYGAVAQGGRGGAICEVTSLDDDRQNPKPGTLRYCISEMTGPRTVIFRVGGVIHAPQLGRRATKDNSYLTIAGQTAPGDGVTINGSLMFANGIHDVVVRYLRLTGGTNNIQMTSASRIIIDHVSARFTTNDNVGSFVDTLSVSTDARVEDVTFSWSIVGPGDASNNHPTGGGWRGATEEVGNNSMELVYNVDLHHNMWTNNAKRNPRTKAGDKARGAGVRLINNVVYNVKWQAFESKGGTVVDYINNYIRHGPMRDNDLDSYIVHETTPTPDSDEQLPEASIFARGNFGEPDFMPAPSDPWSMIFNAWTDQHLGGEHRRDTPLPGAEHQIPVEPAESAWTSVLANVGSNKRLDCQGKWVEIRDAIDSKLVLDAKNGTGPTAPVTPSTFGVRPSYSSGTPCPDRDSDGMPDAYEELNGLDPENRSDRNADKDGDGFTNLEEYLSGS